MNRLICLTFTAIVLLPAPDVHGAKRKLTTDMETIEGALLKHLLDEPDPAQKTALMESFTVKYASHGSATWILAELQAAYIKTNRFEKAIAAGEKILAADPDDVVIANATLKAAEGTKNPELVRKWAITASVTARRIITSFRPLDAEGAAAWHADVEYSKHAAAYADYTLYVLALHSRDPAQLVELGELLKSQSPTSEYIALLRSQLFVSYQQAGNHTRALMIAEEDIKANSKNEDMLIYAASKAYERQDKGKVTVYAKRLLDTLPLKPAPAGISDPDWTRQKNSRLGLAHWMLGMLASKEQRWPDADAHLRAALPNVVNNRGINAETLFHLGLANYKIGEAKSDRNRIVDAIRFNQECSVLAGNFQAQAKQNVVSLRSQYHLQ
jgi:tetratricopeptide (TPR) repeat protein